MSNIDVNAILTLHHPAVVKYFGRKSIINGREELRKQLTGWLGSNKVVFLENTVESTVFNGATAIETSIFSIRNTPKNGDSPSVVRGRSERFSAVFHIVAPNGVCRRWSGPRASPTAPSRSGAGGRPMITT